jgi:hypothetical protein
MSPKKQDPFEIRRELARRFPKWMQPLFTYQMALTPPGQARIASRWSQRRHLAVWLAVYLSSTALGITSVATLLNFLSSAIGG